MCLPTLSGNQSLSNQKSLPNHARGIQATMPIPTSEPETDSLPHPPDEFASEKVQVPHGGPENYHFKTRRQIASLLTIVAQQ